MDKGISDIYSNGKANSCSLSHTHTHTHTGGEKEREQEGERGRGQRMLFYLADLPSVSLGPVPSGDNWPA